MSRPYLSVKHVETMSLLPAKLTRGRAYFIDDEQVIVIDHGLGPVTYGGKPGPQGATGEPIPQMQAQLDGLSEAAFKMQNFMWQESQRVRTQDERIEAHFTEQDEHLQEQINDAASAILTLSSLLHEKFNQYDNAVATLAKAVSELYPPETRPQGGDSGEDPLDNETLSTDAGTWTIQQTYLKDGTILLELEAQELLISTLKPGDNVTYDGTLWKVADKQEQDGFITITLDNL